MKEGWLPFTGLPVRQSCASPPLYTTINSLIHFYSGFRGNYYYLVHEFSRVTGIEGIHIVGKPCYYRGRQVHVRRQVIRNSNTPSDVLVAYYCFDFKDASEHDVRGFLTFLLFQLGCAESYLDDVSSPHIMFHPNHGR